LCFRPEYVISYRKAQ
jgi:hypothetical protein